MAQSKIYNYLPNEQPIYRDHIRELVEDFWRSLILQGRQWGQAHPRMSRAEAESRFGEQSIKMSRQFSDRMEKISYLMSPQQAELFLQIVDDEDRICFDEHQKDPEAFYRRLGLELTTQPRAARPAPYRRQGIGEMAVRTAIRATIWESIYSLFRFFR